MQHLAGQGRDVVNCSGVPNEIRQKMQLHLNARRTRQQDAAFSEAPSGDHLQPSTAMDKKCKICGNAEDGDGEFLILGTQNVPTNISINCACRVTISRLNKEETNRCWYRPSCLCRLCLRDEHNELTVLCDMCDDAYHIYCMNPSRDSIPEENWYCANCNSHNNSSTSNEGVNTKFHSLLKAVELSSQEENYSRQAGGHMDFIFSAMEILDNDQQKSSQGHRS